MFFLVYGEDTFRSRKFLAATREQFSKKRDATGFNTVLVRAREEGMPIALEAIVSSPFLAERKLVILEQFLSEASEKDQAVLAELLPKKPASTNVIFFEDAGQADFKKSPLYALLAAQEYTVEYPALSATEAMQFVRNEIVTRGLVISPGAAQKLVAVVGVESSKLFHEAEKLCAYAAAGNRTTIPEGDIKLLACGSVEPQFFAFLDACFSGQSTEALRYIDASITSPGDGIQMCSALSRHVRSSIAVKELMSRGEKDKNAIAARLGVHPFATGKIMRLVSFFSDAALQSLFCELSAIERRLKSGVTDAGSLLCLFALHVTRAFQEGKQKIHGKDEIHR
jgi:DNA polymerase-3 subunit delta